MNVATVGTGYVGLVTSTCFADMGTVVTCIDINKDKIDRLNRGEVPIYEPGLDMLIDKNMKAGRLLFTTDLIDVLNHQDIVYIAVGTPPFEDGSADLRAVIEVARTIGRHMNKYLLIVTKSTVPVGTGIKVEAAVREELQRRGVDIPFDVASNPEFLKEGDAINDFMKPDRIVVGVNSDKAKSMMEYLYRPFTINGHPILFMDIASAEMTKYTANAMLATRISFMNEIANLCERVGANIHNVRRGVGSDPRIGNRFLYAGCGYGGSCFPKDVKALIRTAKEHNMEMRVVTAVEEVNEDQKKVLFNKAKAYFETLHNIPLKGLTFAIWGLSFKPETDDMREAPSIEIIRLLQEAGCTVRVYDPVAGEEAKKHYLGDSVYYASDIYDAADGADAIMLVTEWKEFRLFNMDTLKEKIRRRVIFDGRNIYDSDEMNNNGFDYFGIGKK